jgi:hypothetical protein
VSTVVMTMNQGIFRYKILKFENVVNTDGAGRAITKFL